jgi:hypothetical protein
MRNASATWRILRMPLLLAVVSIVGLVAALLAAGAADVAWTAAAAFPLLVIAAIFCRQRRS